MRIIWSAPGARISARGSGGCRPRARTRCTSTSVRRSFISCWKVWAGCAWETKLDGAEIRWRARRAGTVAPGIQRHRCRSALANRGAPEELEFLPGAKTKPDTLLIYPVDPKQLPKQLLGVQWPPKA